MTAAWITTVCAVCAAVAVFLLQWRQRHPVKVDRGSFDTTNADYLAMLQRLENRRRK